METEAIWQQVLTALKLDTEIKNNIYDSNLVCAELKQIDNDTYYLIVSSSFAVQSVKDYLPKINDLLSTVIGHVILLKLISSNDWNKIEKPLGKLKEKHSSKITGFDTFVVGSSNKKAYTAAKVVSENLGTKFNPLFIHGNSALGKTHLLKAIQSADGDHPGKKVLYITSTDFGKKAVEVLKDGFDEIEALNDEYKQYDALLLDDVQFLAKREKTNQLLFALFNYFHEHDKQIVITADKTPEQLNGFDSRMITRFTSGLTINIDAPDVITARNILKRLWKEQIGEKYKLNKDAENYLATYYAPNVRKIENVINNICFGIEFADIDSPIIDMSTLQDLLNDNPVSSTGSITVSKIKEVVGEKFGVSPTQIDGKMRVANVVNARHIAMYLTKEILDYSYAQIGAQFGGKDHTTVMNACTKIDKTIKKDKDLNKVIEKLKAEVTTK